MLLHRFMDQQQSSSVKILCLLTVRLELQSKHPWELQTISSLPTFHSVTYPYPLETQSNAQVWAKKKTNTTQNTLFKRMYVSSFSLVQKRKQTADVSHVA